MTDPHHDRRWLILGVIGIAQLLVVLDVTIVNIALPSAQADRQASVRDVAECNRRAAITRTRGLPDVGLVP